MIGVWNVIVASFRWCSTESDGWVWARWRARVSLRAGGRFCGRGDWVAVGLAGDAAGQAATVPQTLIWAGAVRVARRGPAGGKPGRALVFRSRWRFLSTWTRRRARAARMASRRAVIIWAG